MSHRFFRRLKDSTGTSMVEAALVTPLFLLLTFAIVDFASLLYAYLALEHGVSQASRYGITGSVSGELSREDSMRLAMHNATPSLTIPDDQITFTHLKPGEAVWRAGVGDPGDVAKITVNYTWTLFTPLVNRFFTDGEINFQVESAMLSERSFE